MMTGHACLDVRSNPRLGMIPEEMVMVSCKRVRLQAKFEIGGLDVLECLCYELRENVHVIMPRV